VNLTGFAIINTSSARYRAAQREWTRRASEWTRRNPNYWLGARRRLTVSRRHLPAHRLVITPSPVKGSGLLCPALQ